MTGSPDLSAYNPASQTRQARFAVVFGHTEYWDNIRLESAFMSLPLSPRLTWHTGFRLASVDNLEARGDVPSVDPDHFFDLQDISAKTGATFELSDKTSLGLSLGWFFEKISIYRGSAFNVDIGGQYQARDNVRLGASISNIGSTFTLSAPGSVSSGDIKLPTTTRVGASYVYDTYLASLDAFFQDGSAHIHVGGLWHVVEQFDVRAGFASGYDSHDFSAGATWQYRNFGVNYAFVAYSQGLGTTHMFSLNTTL
jgi:hypothetical protein